MSGISECSCSHGHAVVKVISLAETPRVLTQTLRRYSTDPRTHNLSDCAAQRGVLQQLVLTAMPAFDDWSRARLLPLDAVATAPCAPATRRLNHPSSHTGAEWLSKRCL